MTGFSAPTGFAVTILHGGQHEVELPAELVHLHTDPHWSDTLGAGLGRREFDLVIAQYGRLSVTCEVLRGAPDRAREDDLITRWAALRSGWPVDAAPFRPTHAYRHPRRPGEAWRSG